MHEKDLYLASKKFLETKNGYFTKRDLKEFGRIIQAHGDLYYSKEAPIISDTEYDALFKKYSELKKIFGEEVDISIKTGDFGQSSFKKIAHSRPMISLDNTYNEEDLRDFDVRVKKILKASHDTSLNFHATTQSGILSLPEEKIEYTVEYKFDGLGVELIYKKGKFVQAITRGNGIEGEDVTENVRQIQNIPHMIDYTEDIEIRGEVLMPLSSFEKLNIKAKELGGKIFANPRNAASGSLRIKDTSITANRDLRFFAYDISDFGELGSTTYFEMIQKLRMLQFDISSYFLECDGIESVISQIENFGDRKKHIDFEIDGLVVKVNDMSLWDNIGKTEHHPRYAIAYKFPAEIQTTQIESVEHSVGRTGTITPVANVSPVNLGGAVIRRSTLHNYDEIQKLDVRIGDTVFIKRAGEVIPKIISVALEARDGSEQVIDIPKICPSCSSSVFKDEDKVRYYCANKISCPAQNKEQLAHSVGKNGLDIDGLGERQVEIFLTEGLITNLVDIFHLKDKREEILELEGFQEKSVDKLLDAIEQAKNIDITKFMRSIGILGVGKKTGKILSGVFHNEGDLINFTLSVQELEDLPDIGPGVAKNVAQFFETRKEYIIDLIEVLEISFPEQQNTSGGKYAGKKMCITGSFVGYSRDELIEILESQGGEFTSSVSKNTDYLLAGEKAGGKLSKAEGLGVKVLSLEDFLKI